MAWIKFGFSTWMLWLLNTCCSSELFFSKDDYLMGTIYIEKLKNIFPNFSIKNIDKMTYDNLALILDDESLVSTTLCICKIPKDVRIGESLFSVLDLYLMSRLWWRINHYVISPTDDVEYIIFQRASKALESGLHILAAKNYPKSNKDCSERPLAVRNLNGATWGNGARNAMVFLTVHSKYVTLSYCTRSGKLAEGTNFNDETECTDKYNKYECVFLPSTNCSTPINVTQDILKHENLIYRNTTIDGELLDTSKLWEYDKHDFKDLKEYRLDRPYISEHHIVYKFYTSKSYHRTGKSPNIILNETVYSSMRESGDYHAVKLLFNYLYRLNSHMKWKVQKITDHFRMSFSPNFLPDSKCVMIHMRRDDRRINHEDMTAWCKNHSYFDEKLKSWRPMGTYGKNNDPVDSTTMYDYGCNLVLPYGAATLEHYLNASLILLPSITNLLISTDDGNSLKEELDAYLKVPGNLVHKHNLKIYPISPRVGHRRDYSMDLVAEFFATIELGQQCSGFVGYPFASAVGQLFYESLCYSSYYTELNCPPMFNLAEVI
jgi:hypothetical protein